MLLIITESLNFKTVKL